MEDQRRTSQSTSLGDTLALGAVVVGAVGAVIAFVALPWIKALGVALLLLSVSFAAWSHLARRRLARLTRLALAGVLGAGALAALILGWRFEGVPSTPSTASGANEAQTVATPVPSRTIEAALPVEYGSYPGDRPTYAYTGLQFSNANLVVLNSATDHPTLQDERWFLSLGGDESQAVNRRSVRPGDTVSLRISIVNDANPMSLGDSQALALDVRARLIVPATEATWFNLVAFLSTDNSEIPTMNDSALLVGTQPLRLLYVPGSARLYREWNGRDYKIEPLSDSLIAGDGVGIGNVAPGVQGTEFITAEVKVVGA